MPILIRQAGRIWRLRPMIVAAVIAVVLWRLVPTPIAIPGRSGGIEWVLSPLLPAVIVVPAINAANSAFRANELISARPWVHQRMAFVTFTGALLLASILVGVGVAEDAQQAARNAALMIGLTLLSVTLLARPVQWVPVVAFPLVSWLVGVPSAGQPPDTWAVLLHDTSSEIALWVTGVALVAGIGSYLTMPHPRVPLPDTAPQD